jgi:hypothetical protein
MIKRPSASTKAASVPTAPNSVPGAAQSDLMSPSDVLLIDGVETKPMRYLNPKVRTAAGARRTCVLRAPCQMGGAIWDGLVRGSARYDRPVPVRLRSRSRPLAQIIRQKHRRLAV